MQRKIQSSLHNALKHRRRRRGDENGVGGKQDENNDMQIKGMKQITTLFVLSRKHRTGGEDGLAVNINASVQVFLAILTGRMLPFVLRVQLPI